MCITDLIPWKRKRKREVLPCAVDAEGVEATLREGLLTVTLPKVEDARPKAIEIQIE
jgi:HSP20 family molecular chaperone IbpA